MKCRNDSDGCCLTFSVLPKVSASIAAVDHCVVISINCVFLYLPKIKGACGLSQPTQKDTSAACITMFSPPLTALSSRTICLRAVRVRLEGTWWDSRLNEDLIVERRRNTLSVGCAM